MGTQLRSMTSTHHYFHDVVKSYSSLAPQTTSSQSFSSPTTSSLLLKKRNNSPKTGKSDEVKGVVGRQRRRYYYGIVASRNDGAAPFWDVWTPEKAPSAPSLGDILWPSAGAFAAMALLGKMDQILAPKGVSMTIAPLGAVCAVLFATPSSPVLGHHCVLAFSIFGPGWLARSAAFAASIAFKIFKRSTHPPGNPTSIIEGVGAQFINAAASLPILFIDGAKLHHLNFWYALFAGAAGCVLLCLIQEVVMYLKNNLKF